MRYPPRAVNHENKKRNYGKLLEAFVLHPPYPEHALKTTALFTSRCVILRKNGLCHFFFVCRLFSLTMQFLHISPVIL